MSKRKRSRSDSISNTSAAQVRSLLEDLTELAHQIVYERWPEKIIAISALFARCQAEVFTPATLSDVAADAVPVHADVKRAVGYVKREVRVLVEDLTKLITWVRLVAPRLEDGNNFGVAVQQDILANLISGRNSAIQVTQSITQYYYSRGRLFRRRKKAMRVDDYASAIASFDDKQFTEAVQIVADLRSIYLMLTDKIHKNWKNLCTPKGENPSASRDLYC